MQFPEPLGVYVHGTWFVSRAKYWPIIKLAGPGQTSALAVPANEQPNPAHGPTNISWDEPVHEPLKA